jgi:hypothetical protein
MLSGRLLQKKYILLSLGCGVFEQGRQVGSTGMLLQVIANGAFMEVSSAG